MRILLIQQSIDPPGGGNAVAAWMLHALADQHELATLTLRRWSPERVDDFYGTQLTRASIAQLHAPRGWRLLDSIPMELARLRMAVLFRAAQQVQEDVDLLITADNYGAFRSGLQYLHYPAAIRPQPLRYAPFVHGYYRVCDALSGLSWDTARLNVTLANSRWTASVLERERAIQARVLYPPVVDPGPGLPWHERDNTMLCVGRFHGSKRIELAIAIAARVREMVPDLRLCIVGSNVDREYTQRIRSLASPLPWVSIEEDLPQRQLLSLMGRSRYGIHAMVDEHFGMAVAEMARARCIVFVHDSGGQVEAVGNFPELLWREEDDAVGRIRACAQRSLSHQQALSDGLRAHAAQFSREHFVAKFRAIVNDHGTAIALNRGSRNSSS